MYYKDGIVKLGLFQVYIWSPYGDVNLKQTLLNVERYLQNAEDSNWICQLSFN